MSTRQTKEEFDFMVMQRRLMAKSAAIMARRHQATTRWKGNTIEAYKNGVWVVVYRAF